MIKITTLFILSIAFYFSFQPNVFACQFKGIEGGSKSGKIFYSINLEREKSYLYGDGALHGQKNKAKIFIQNCDGQKFYTMLAIGNRFFNSKSNTGIVSYTPQLENFRERQCNRGNKVIASIDSNKRTSNIIERNNILKKCLKRTVTSNHAISLVPNQKHCKLEQRLSSTKIQVSGDYCFFNKTGKKTSYVLSMEISDKCHKEAFFKENSYNVTHLEGGVEFFSAQSYIEGKQKLSIKSSTTFTMTFVANPNLVPQADNYYERVPSWPKNWTPENIHLANIEIDEKESDNDRITQRIRVPFFVDHRCPENCQEGLCSSACEYPIPLAAELELFKLLPNGKKASLLIWYEGAKIPPMWFGLTAGHPINLSTHLEEKQKYYLKAKFFDPRTDFLILKKFLKKMEGIGGIGSVGGFNIGEGGVPNVRDVGSVDGENREPPALGTISGLPSSFSGEGLKAKFDFSQSISSLISIPNWPPIYQNICSNNFSTNKNQCHGIDPKVPFLLLETYFTLGKKQNVGRGRFSKKTILPIENVFHFRRYSDQPEKNYKQKTNEPVSCR